MPQHVFNSSSSSHNSSLARYLLVVQVLQTLRSFNLLRSNPTTRQIPLRVTRCIPFVSPRSASVCLRKPPSTRSSVAILKFPRSYKIATLFTALPLTVIWFQTQSPVALPQLLTSRRSFDVGYVCHRTSLQGVNRCLVREGLSRGSVVAITKL